MLVFYSFAAIVILLGILSLRSGVDFRRYVRAEVARKLPDYTPYVSLIAPCRGLEQDLQDNLAALIKQDYPAFQIIFVTDRADDPSLAAINHTLLQATGRPEIATKIAIAGAAFDSGQKVHNLRVAVEQVDARCEVLVFVDSDVRPDANWLRALVAPLNDKGIGAATGYRWFIPRSGFASHLRAVWNASITSALGARTDKNFCWGGSTAIRRETFEQLRVSEAWSGTVSDDFTLTHVLQAAKLPIHFAPACLVPAMDDCTMNELIEFSNRQLKITRVYAPHLWKPLLIGSFLFTAVFFGGLALVLGRAAYGLSLSIPFLLLVVILLLGSWKAYVRWQAVGLVVRRLSYQGLAAHLFLWPLTSALFLWNALLAGFSRRITWRGIAYELKSATEAVIIRQ